MSRHVSQVCEEIEAAKVRRASVRETISHLQTKLLTESTPREPNPPSLCLQALATGLGFSDEVARSSDLFSAIRRVVFPYLKQMDTETPQCKRRPPSDHEISDVEQVDTETEAEQMERLMQVQGENSQLVPFRKKGAKETKELIVLSSLIPDCRLTAGNLFREASLHDPRSILSFAQVAAHRGTPTDLWEAFCSLPEAHDHHLVLHVHGFTDGSVDFDEAQSSSPVPPSALSAGFSGVVFVACGEELLFLGAFCSPLFQHFSQWKTPSASQAKLAAVASTPELFGGALAGRGLWAVLFGRSGLSETNSKAIQKVKTFECVCAVFQCFCVWDGFAEKNLLLNGFVLMGLQIKTLLSDVFVRFLCFSVSGPTQRPIHM